ncbi:hypothetical protein GCM10009757_09990 [Streptomyces cheonanensis]|uniref:Uncharacterized protein n=1 Tax=Streptomyces cheonanensis TaxID=312720 RepID=A0ABP5GDE1_9ACTN
MLNDVMAPAGISSCSMDRAWRKEALTGQSGTGHGPLLSASAGGVRAGGGGSGGRVARETKTARNMTPAGDNRR